MATKEIWSKWRIIWESDPKMTLAGVAEGMGVTRQGVSRRARSENWTKIGNNDRIVKKAHQKADQLTPAAAPEKPPHSDPPEPAPEPIPIPPPINPGVVLSEAVEDGAADARANILSRHRTEWVGVRSQLYKGMKDSNFEALKRAKISAEATKILQEGERKAWGLDIEDKPEKPGEIIRG